VLRVVSLFAPDAENILANIAVLVAKEAINKDECQELALQVHNMKASAKFLGLSSLAEEAVFFECAIGNNQFKIWPDLLVALRKEVELANCELAAIVKRIV
jgi:HPt (histidine-containing phosphotransfer) domain-containing protein